MKYPLLLLCLLSFAAVARAQRNYKEAIQMGDAAFKRGEYITAMNKYFAAEAFDPAKRDVVKAKVKAVFERIERLRGEANSAKKKAQAALEQVKTEQAKAQLALVEAEKARSLAEEEKRKAEQTARSAYANDLVYKSQSALRNGDHNTSFRLAEFAHRYVDDENPNVTRALVETLYCCNDNIDHQSLPRFCSFEGHLLEVLSVAFSPDGKRLATGSSDWTAKIWDVASQKLLYTLGGHSARILSVAFSPDGQRLATSSSDRTVKIWDTTNGKLLFTLEGHTGWVSSVAFSPDGQTIATGSSDRTAKIWDLVFGKPLLTLEGHTARILSVAFSPDGQRIATGSSDRTIKIWDIHSGSPLLSLEGHTDWIGAISFSPDGQRLASGSDDKTTKIWDVASGKSLLTLEGHMARVSSVSFSPDGQRFATGSYDKTAKIWDVASGKTLLNLESTAIIQSVSFSPDGRGLAISSYDKTAKIWDVDPKPRNLIFDKTLVSFNDRESSTLFYTGNGQRFAIIDTFRNVAIIRDVNSQKELTLEGHQAGILSAAFSPDGQFLVTSSKDQTAKVWDLSAGKTVLNLEGHTSAVNSVAFSPNGLCLATGSSDGTAKIWDLTSGKVLLTFKAHSGKINNVVFSPDGKMLATRSDDDMTKIWELTPDRLIAHWQDNGCSPALLPAHLQQYNLESLLDQYPDNEQKLIATGEVWQIVHFAELYDHQAAGIGILYRVEPLYARADRLYSAAGRLQDERYIREAHAGMLRRWAQVYRDNGQPQRAGELERRAEGLGR